MNLDFNPILKKAMPYIFVLLAAFSINSVVSLFLPKAGVDYIESSSSDVVFLNYDGYYSKIKINTPKIDKQLKKKDIQTLSSFELKAVYSTTSNGGWAIIQKKGSANSTILEQYQKFNGYILTKLFKKYVVFEKDSNEYKIELPKDKNVNYSVKRKQNNIDENVQVSEDGIKVNRNYLNSYVNDIDKVWNNIAINDIRKNGVIEGFRVDRIASGSVFYKLGLKQGDIIKSINNKEIKSYADAFKIYNEINKLSFLKIDVLRNNEMVELNYEID